MSKITILTVLLTFLFNITACNSINSLKPNESNCNYSWKNIAKVPIVAEANLESKSLDNFYNRVELKNVNFLKGNMRENTLIYPKNRGNILNRRAIAFIDIIGGNRYYLNSICSLKYKKIVNQEIKNQQDILLNKKYLKYLKDNKEVDMLIENISNNVAVNKSINKLLSLGDTATSAIIANLNRYKYTSFNSTVILPNNSANSFEAHAMYQPKSITSLLLIILDKIEKESFYTSMLDNQEYIDNAINAWYIWLYKRRK